jgi:hypothetical protein
MAMARFGSVLWATAKHSTLPSRRLLSEVVSHSELTVVPALVRLGDPCSPKLDHVRHRLMPNVKTFADVNVEERDGIISVTPEMVVVQDTGIATLAGVSTFNKALPAFALAVAQLKPKSAALWTLQASSIVPPSLVVRRDPGHSRHVLWAPRMYLALAEYKAALASVGRDRHGAYSGWKRWDDPLEFLDQLPLPAAEKAELVADTESLMAKARKRPTTPAQFLGKAMLSLAFDQIDESGPPDVDYLSAMARLGEAIFDDTWGLGVLSHVSAICRQITAVTTGSAAIAGAAASPKSFPAKGSYSASSHLGVDVVLTVVDCTTLRLPLRNEEVQFMYQALVAARREVMAAAMELPEEAGDDFDNGVEDMRQQCELGRQAAIALGFTRMPW